MNNYKLIEDRKELSREEVLAGMNFAALTAATIVVPKKVFPKSLLVTGVGIIAVAASVLIYKQFNDPAPGKQASVNLIKTENDTIINSASDTLAEQKKLSTRSLEISGTNVPELLTKKKDSIDSITTLSTTVTNTTPLVPSKTPTINPIEKTGTTIRDNSTFKFTANVECKILTSKNFCKLHEIEPLQVKTDCNGCDFYPMKCGELKDKNLIPVSITYSDKKGELNLESVFKNITLIRANGEKVHPYAINTFGMASGDGETGFYGPGFKAKNFKAKFSGKNQLILLFTLASPGDVVIVDRDLVAEIREERTLLPFEKQINADSKYALEIPMTVYGPVNVSKGYGEIIEYKDRAQKNSEEANSAWFKFKVQKDTLLTFHIVPQLYTDDFDFALFKCVTDDCTSQLMQKKLSPVKKCFSWNTSHNCNTGLSQSAKDTLFEAVFATGEKKGQTYASGLRVKAGETYYLMVSTNMGNNQEPAGFKIYFFNNLPAKKANTYKK